MISPVAGTDFHKRTVAGPAQAGGSKAAAAIRWLLLALTSGLFSYLCLASLRLIPGIASELLLGTALLLSFTTTIAWQTRQLPFQNVMMASVIIGTLSSIISVIGSLTGFPFGSFDYTSYAGPTLFNRLPLTVPLVWVVVLLNARGVARLMLSPFRSRPNYGLWVIGVSGLLTAGFAMAWDPFASALHNYWNWHSKTSFTWYGAPRVAFLAWICSSMLILALATPSLINKKPVTLPPDPFPLLMWCFVLIFLSANLVRHGLHRAAAVAGVVVLASGVVSLAGLWMRRNAALGA